MVPYVCQNVYVVCFFRPDSFPCFLSNEPRSPRGSEPKPHAIYTDRTAGALPAKAVRDEEVGGWVEKLLWKLQVKPSVRNVSLFTFFFFLDSFVFLSVIFFLPWVSTELPGQARIRSAAPSDKHQSFESCVTSLYSLFFIALFICVCVCVFNSLCSWCFSSLTHTFSPCFQLKQLAVLDRTRKVDFPLQLRSNTFCSFVAPDKADLLLQNWAFCISFPFFCSVAPVVPVLLWTSILWSSLFTALRFTYVSLSSLHFTSLFLSYLFSTGLYSVLSFSPCELLRREEKVNLIDASFSLRPLSQSDITSQARWANERWRDINLIAVRDRCIDRGGCEGAPCEISLSV